MEIYLSLSRSVPLCTMWTPGEHGWEKALYQFTFKCIWNTIQTDPISQFPSLLEAPRALKFIEKAALCRGFLIENLYRPTMALAMALCCRGRAKSSPEIWKKKPAGAACIRSRYHAEAISQVGRRRSANIFTVLSMRKIIENRILNFFLPSAFSRINEVKFVLLCGGDLCRHLQTETS